MVIADFVLLAIVLAAIILGYKCGVGKVLNFVTKGFVGKIMSIVVCYFIYGMVLEISFVQSLLNSFVDWVASSESSIVRVLLYVRIDMIVFFVALFFLVQLIKKIVVMLIGKIFSIAPVLDKSLGIALSLVFAAASILIIFQICFWISGADGGVYKILEGSLFRLEGLYLNNPLNSIIESIDISHVIGK